LEATTSGNSRVDLTLPASSRLEIRSGAAGVWAGENRQTHSMATHNCMTPPQWFSPHLFLQNAAQNSAYSVTYVGAEVRNGEQVQHLAIQLTNLLGGGALTAHLSSVDVYLDAATYLPSSFVFSQHPDENALYNLPVEVQFSGYQAGRGINYPSQIVKLYQGTVLLDLSVSSIAVNPTIPDSDFNF
jgi:hypothetical protein